MIRFESVGMRYGDGPEILKDVSFELQPGSFHFLTGRSGAGKTTLLSLLYLALRPTRGFVSLFGHDIATTARGDLPGLRRRIGVVFQDFRLIEHLSTFENVSLPLRIAGMSPRDYADDVEELLAWVGLGDKMEAKPATLSGGEKQRVAIARAIVTKPDLLLADEPTGNVDEEMGFRLLRLFVELNRLGTSVVIATHDTSLTRRVEAAHLHLDAGRLDVIAAGEARRRDPAAPAPATGVEAEA